MKQCYHCKILGVSDEENQHYDDELGGYDIDTRKWVCDECVWSAKEEGQELVGEYI